MQHLIGIMTPVRYLLIGGATLTLLGIAGVTGVLRHLSSRSLFNHPVWINWVHFGAGLAVLRVATAGGPSLQHVVVGFGAVVGITLGVLGLLFGRAAARKFRIPEFADPSDHLAHLTVGLMALWAVVNVTSPDTKSLLRLARPSHIVDL